MPDQNGAPRLQYEPSSEKLDNKALTCTVWAIGAVVLLVVIAAVFMLLYVITFFMSGFDTMH